MLYRLTVFVSMIALLLIGTASAQEAPQFESPPAITEDRDQVLREHLQHHMLTGAITMFGSMAGAGFLLYIGADPMLAAAMAPGVLVGILELTSASDGLDKVNPADAVSAGQTPSVVKEDGK